MKDADWVVEAVVERIDIKHNIYEKILNQEKQVQLFHPILHHTIKILSEKLTKKKKRFLYYTLL